MHEIPMCIGVSSIAKILHQNSDYSYSIHTASITLKNTDFYIYIFLLFNIQYMRIYLAQNLEEARKRNKQWEHTNYVYMYIYNNEIGFFKCRLVSEIFGRISKC